MVPVFRFEHSSISNFEILHFYVLESYISYIGIAAHPVVDDIILATKIVYLQFPPHFPSHMRRLHYIMQQFAH